VGLLELLVRERRGREGKGREREGEGEGRGFAVPMSNCFLCASVLSKITY